MRRPKATLAVTALLAACASSAGRDGEHPGDFLPDLDRVVRGIEVDRLALTTEVDPVTFAPAGPTGTTFPASTRRLYLCFRARNGPEVGRLAVVWYRVGESTPLSETEQVIDGEQWLAAEHEPRLRFASGPHFVRVELDGVPVARVDFTIAEADEPRAAEPEPFGVSRFRLVRSLDTRGRPTGATVTSLPPGSREVHCAFVVSGAPRGTSVRVRWLRSGTLVSTTDLGTTEGRAELAASLLATSPIPSGLYRVEVLLDGRVAHSGQFTVVAETGAGGAFPSVSGLALATAVDPRTRRPVGPLLTRLRGDEPTIYLSLQFSGMRPNDRIRVRWFEDSHPGEPMAETEFEVSDRGALAASFSAAGSLPPGAYHVEVVRGADVLGTLDFVVEGPPEAAGD